MERDSQEQTYWLRLVFESKLPKRVIHHIIDTWCVELGRTLQEFFAASPQEWIDSCNLSKRMIERLEQAHSRASDRTVHEESLSSPDESSGETLRIAEARPGKERVNLDDHIHMLTVLDDNYPRLLKSALEPDKRPPVLFYAGDLHILELISVAIIGSRNAGKASLAFTWYAARYLAEQGANVISGNARGVDRAAYEGATSTCGCTTIVLPHGIRKLSQVQMRELLPKIEAGNVLLLSQFHPEASWTVSRAMERNNVVTGLAQVVIIAESNLQGGTWAAANGVLQQQQPLYVRQTNAPFSLPGNQALIERGGRPLLWSIDEQSQEPPLLEDVLSPILEESDLLYHKQQYVLELSQQLFQLLEEQRLSYANS